MKKLFVVCAATIVTGIACIYIFIPAQLNISAANIMPAPLNAMHRCAGNEDNWPGWLGISSDSFHKAYAINSSFINGVNIRINGDKDSLYTLLNLASLNKDSTLVQWSCMMQSGIDPISKIKSYNKAAGIKKKMDSALRRMKLFTSKSENIYGVHIYESSIQDTLLITTKTNLSHYPSTNDIYKLVNTLQTYASKLNTRITGYPMYNVANEGIIKRLMVAIPIEKDVPQHDSISTVRMVPGKFIITEVKGGEATVQNGLAQLKNFFSDYSRTSMAIPFAYLITNRIEQPDTTTWITKIYAPVY
jgi:hypothetical protein